MANLNAGQIQIGQVISGVNDGLTTTYVTTGCAGVSGCVAGSTGGNGLRGYDNQLFSGAIPAPTVFAGQMGYEPATSGSLPGTVYDSANQVTFAMISQNTNNSSVWASLGTNATVIPMGIFGVTDVWTMLNDYWGQSGAQDTVVTFTFGTQAGGAADTTAANLTTVTFDLTNGKQIRSAVDCTGSSDSGTECSSLDFATTLQTSTAAAPVASSATVTVGLGAPATASYNVLTNNLYSQLYTNAAFAPYINTTGTAVLDDQGFEFGNQFVNDYLVSVSVSNQGYLSCAAAPCTTASRTALSAITVDTASGSSAPEPSTAMLVLGGFGLLGFARFTRKRT
jgi:hypothetical protein